MKKALVIHCIVLSVLLIAALLLIPFRLEKQRVPQDRLSYEGLQEKFLAAKKECINLLDNKEFCLLTDTLYEETPEGQETYYLLYEDWAGIERPLNAEDASVFMPKILNSDFDFKTPAPEKILQAYKAFYASYYSSAKGFLNRLFAGRTDDMINTITNTVCVYKDAEKEYIRFDLDGDLDYFFLIRGNPEDAMKFNVFLEYMNEDPAEYDIILYSQCADSPYPWYMIYFPY